MAEPFLAEIRVFSFNFPPKGWALCNGQLLPINQNQALFALLGTTYGGDGRVNFALPDLRARAPIHAGGTHTLGERAGEQTHTLTSSEIPTHTHQMSAGSGTADQLIPSNTRNLQQTIPNLFYHAPSSLVGMDASSLTGAGGSQAHLNMQPSLVLNFCIALQGIFPSPN